MSVLGAMIGMDTRRHKLGLLGLRRSALGDFDRVRDFNTRDSDSEDDKDPTKSSGNTNSTSTQRRSSVRKDVG